MPDHIADPVRHPEHYTMYPVEPIEITRHLGFCLGNAVKYVLRAPWKGGAEDCDKALQYLAWERETRQGALNGAAAFAVSKAADKLMLYLVETDGDGLWTDISGAQYEFLDQLQYYLANWGTDHAEIFRANLATVVRDLRRILSLRDTTGQIYEGMSGLPGSCVDE